jgi:hypothetical protein
MAGVQEYLQREGSLLSVAAYVSHFVHSKLLLDSHLCLVIILITVVAFIAIVLFSIFLLFFLLVELLESLHFLLHFVGLSKYLEAHIASEEND